MTKIYVFPGQGSQKKGMGGELFEKFPAEIALADEVLGYSLRELCVDDPEDKLGRTEFTQPALFFVSALMYLQKLQDTGNKPDFVAGHSLGEFSALFAAGVFDLATGLRLVKKRGELMSQATGGGMAAVVGLSRDQISETLNSAGYAGIDIANLNAPMQTVISGLQADIQAAKPLLESAGAKMVVPLKVSGAFHSRYMQPARQAFEAFLDDFSFSPLQIPVLSNVQALPYTQEQIKENLSRQIVSPVRWVEIIQFLLQQPQPEVEEVGPGVVLTGLLRQIKAAAV